MDSLEQRIHALEKWRTEIEVSLSKHEINYEYMRKEFAELREDLKDIKKLAKTLNLTVWGAVIVILVRFALSGGFSSVL